MPKQIVQKAHTIEAPMGEEVYSTPPRKSGRPRLLTITLLLLAVLALMHFIAVTHSAYPSIKISDCKGLIRNTDYKKYVQMNSKTQILDEVQFVDELVGNQPAALVTIADSEPQHLLDTYIYGCTQVTGTPSLTLLFKKQGLAQGSIKVTQDNTLSIGEQDSTLTQDISTLQEPLQANVYREYSWRSGSFVQVPFAGLYPVISRAEAEAMQEQSDNGQVYPWTDPLATTEQMAKDILQLSNPKVNLQDNNGRTAHVLVEQDTSHLAVIVTLTRLLQNDNNGLWFVTQAHSSTMNGDTANEPLTSPFTLHGNMSYVQGELQTSVMLFDHTLSALHVLNKPEIKVWDNGSYSTIVKYTNNIANQPGLVLIKVQPADAGDGQLLLTSALLG